MEENIQTIENESRNVPVKDLLLIAGTLLLGILSVTLFFENSLGISIPIFVAAFYTVMLLHGRGRLLKGSLFGWFLILPIVMLSLTYCFFASELFRPLNLLALPVLIVLQTLLVTGGNNFSWHSPAILLDLFLGIFFRCIVHVFKPFRLIGRAIVQKTGNSKLNPSIARVLAGLAISLPIVAILIALLSSADMVFNSMMSAIPELLRELNLGEAIVKVILGGAIFLLSFSYLWSLSIDEKPGSGLKDTVQGTLPRVWDPVTILTVAAVIDLIYVAFVAVQFAYLFGGLSIGLPADFTYAEYARRGFFELVAVTVINIGILAAFLSFTKNTGPKAGPALRVLYTVMIGCTFVMLFSAHLRMSLYEEAYGYTHLRMYTHLFMAFLLILFIITLYRVWADRAQLLKPYIITAIAAFVVVNYMNVDALIVRSNSDRFDKTGKIDAYYLQALSNDAIPDIVALAKAHPEIGGQLKDYLDRKARELSGHRDWQSFNLADDKAARALEQR